LEIAKQTSLSIYYSRQTDNFSTSLSPAVHFAFLYSNVKAGLYEPLAQTCVPKCQLSLLWKHGGNDGNGCQPAIDFSTV
jgi:hypothetical protein